MDVFGKKLIFHNFIIFNIVSYFLVRRDESPENYCHSPGVVVGGGDVVGVDVVHRQKL